MPASTLRYQLPRKAIKSDCPECGSKHRRTLSRYVDTRTGELLPDIYGRCDRESNCGYYLSPYTKGQSGLSYADAMYQRWKEDKQRVAACLRTSFSPPTYPKSVIATQTNVSMAKQAIYALPDQVFTKSLGHYDKNQFARLLRQHFGIVIADELLHRFQIGTSKSWNGAGACVFWLIDEQGRKRGGQIKLFDDNFHTVKYVDRDGKNRTRTSWVHASLAYMYEQQKLARPEWLTNYIEQADFAPCLFGLPQLLFEDDNKPIAIVEAPKTAVLATPYFPQFIWLAVVARSYLKAERLTPLKGRSIVLFPDLSKDGRDYAYWKDKINTLRHEGFRVVISDWLERLATDEEREKGFDLADYLLTQWQNYPPSWDADSNSILLIKLP